MKWFLQWFGLFFMGWLGLLIADASFPLPIPDPQEKFAQVVTDRRGEPLRVFSDTQGVWRYPVAIELISPAYFEALLTYEDRWFYHHQGINPLSLIRAIKQWIQHGRPVSGGSTITMQVARLLDPHEKSIRGKLKQIFRAWQLERQFTKQEILNLYASYAPFGGPVEGVEAASFVFLGKSSSQLTDAEAAMLAVMPQSPSRFRPDRYPERAEQARNKVLHRLQAFEVWSKNRIDEAMMEPVIAQYHSSPQIAPLLARRLHQQFENQSVIQTTIDRDLQISTESLVNDYMRSFPNKTSAAVLIIDNHSMDVLTYIGSADFSNPDRLGHVDMVSALRSPGSTLKPFLYALAIDEGLIHEKSLLLDVPSDFSGYRPDNFRRGFSGAVSVRESLQRSLNIPAVQVLNELTPDTFYRRLASAGLHLHLPKGAKPNLSLILGGTSTTLEQLTQTFSSLQNKGYVQPLRYLAKSPKPLPRKIMSEDSAWIVSDMLRGASLNFSSRHHSTVAQSLPDIPFKTGTSFGYRDAWVIAATKNKTIGVWIGRPDGTPLVDNQGRRSAVPLLQRIMRLLPRSDWQLAEKPEDVVRQKICWPTGEIFHPKHRADCLVKKNAWLKDGVAPLTLRDPFLSQWSGYRSKITVNKNGLRVLPACTTQETYSRSQVLWPVSLEPFLPMQWRRSSLIPPFSQSCQPIAGNHSQFASQLAIVGIKENSLIQQAPGDNTAVIIDASLIGATGKTHWYLNRHWIGTTEQEHKKPITGLRLGENTIQVMDQTGQLAEVTFEYRSG